MRCENCKDYRCMERRTAGDCVYDSVTNDKIVIPLEYQQPDRWDDFRKEAAKDILCNMVNGGYDSSRIVEQTELAIRYADELIKQLKK